MVKIHSRSTSAFLETGFSLFSKRILIFERAAPFFVHVCLCCQLISVSPTPCGGAGSRQWWCCEQRPSQPRHHEPLGLSKQSLRGSGRCWWCPALLPTTSACCPRLQPAEKTLPQSCAPQAGLGWAPSPRAQGALPLSALLLSQGIQKRTKIRKLF